MLNFLCHHWLKRIKCTHTHTQHHSSLPNVFPATSHSSSDIQTEPLPSSGGNYGAIGPPVRRSSLPASAASSNMPPNMRKITRGWFYMSLCHSHTHTRTCICICLHSQKHTYSQLTFTGVVQQDRILRLHWKMLVKMIPSIRLPHFSHNLPPPPFPLTHGFRMSTKEKGGGATAGRGFM